jgi:zinc transporter 1/2/3
MFSNLLVLVAAAAVASVTAQTTTSTTGAAAAPTEVTDCHAHGESELFCFDADNEEWELTSSGFTADNLPEAFTGCHMHDEEL